MPDATELLKAMKQSSIDAVEATKPVNICFGIVTGTSPLEINVEQRMTLGAKQLILTSAVTDQTVTATIDWTTGSTSGGSGEASFASHSHTVSGDKTITIHNALSVGDEVILLRQQGGQKYIVLDKVG